MTEIRNATLEISAGTDHPGLRRVRVAYHLHTSTDDKILSQYVTETISIHAVSCHDAPIEPTTDPVSSMETSYQATEGDVRRVVDQTVLRTDLDVDQDWWSSAQDGAVVPIAEWVDHLVAEVQIVCNGEVQAQVLTPMVSGSWGALGSD